MPFSCSFLGKLFRPNFSSSSKNIKILKKKSREKIEGSKKVTRVDVKVTQNRIPVTRKKFPIAIIFEMLFEAQ